MKYIRTRKQSKMCGTNTRMQNYSRSNLFEKRENDDNHGRQASQDPLRVSDETITWWRDSKIQEACKDLYKLRGSIWEIKWNKQDSQFRDERGGTFEHLIQANKKYEGCMKTRINSSSIVEFSSLSTNQRHFSHLRMYVRE